MKLRARSLYNYVMVIVTLVGNGLLFPPRRRSRKKVR